MVAAGFVGWPMLRRRQGAVEVDHQQLVRSIYRARLAELANETDDGQLRSEMESELGAVLLTDARTDALADEPRSPARVGLVGWLCIALIPLGGLTLYLSISDPELQQIRGAEEVLSLANDDVAVQSWALKLQERVGNAPDDGKSWYLLGHARLKLGQFADAAQAFASTDNLTPGDIGVQVYWLQARYLAAGGRLDDVSRGLADTVLEQQPNLPVVLEILALDAVHRGESAEAVALLNRAMTSTTDIRQQATFSSAIQQVRSGFSEVPPGITVKVATSGEPSPHSTIFVVARPPGGGMPYAVARRPAFMLPFEVRLDDLVSMSPARKLSDAEAFEIVVRLSVSGNAMPQPGDWQWQSSSLAIQSGDAPVVEAMLVPP
jgi:cytochrome c-type biogenesis protein CcmH